MAENTSISEIYSIDFGIVRTEIENGEIYFCGRDVANALGYTNPNKALGDHCKGITKRYPLPTAGGMQDARFINYSDVYRLIASSKLPNAEKFESWIFDDVLPSIRKTGGYIATDGTETPEQLYERVMGMLHATIESQKKQLEGATDTIERLAPKAAFADSVANTENTITITALARQLAQANHSINRNRLYALLRMDGMIEKHTNAPTNRAIKQGLMEQKQGSYADTKLYEPYARVTQKGVKWCFKHYCGTAVVATEVR